MNNGSVKRGRPKKRQMSFFSMETGFFDDLQIKRLRRVHGSLGTDVYLHLLCAIFGSDTGYYLQLDREELCAMIADDVGCGVTEEEVAEVLATLQKLDLLDASLLADGVVTSYKVQEKYEALASRMKRTEKLVSEYSLFDGEGISSEENRFSSEENRISSEINAFSSEERAFSSRNRTEQDKTGQQQQQQQVNRAVQTVRKSTNEAEEKNGAEEGTAKRPEGVSIETVEALIAHVRDDLMNGNGSAAGAQRGLIHEWLHKMDAQCVDYAIRQAAGKENALGYFIGVMRNMEKAGIKTAEALPDKQKPNVGSGPWRDEATAAMYANYFDGEDDLALDYLTR